MKKRTVLVLFPESIYSQANKHLYAPTLLIRWHFQPHWTPLNRHQTYGHAPGTIVLFFVPGLPGFCHLLRVVGNSIPPYIKDKGRSAKESASCGWQIAAKKECLFGASRQFLWKSKVWHYYDRQPSGLPGSWTLKMTTGNLICRPTPVADSRAKCWQALSGRNEENHFSYVEFFFGTGRCDDSSNLRRPSPSCIIFLF